jgi:putative ABC transport system ATP-binding protein
MPLIQIINVSKIYVSGKNILTKALEDINMTFESQGFTAIAGPSGSGKSSLLHLIGALDSPTQGKILYEGEDITLLNPDTLAAFRRHHIGFVFQAYNLINTLTALENVEYIMLLQGIPLRERQKKAADLLQRVGLGDYIHRFPNEMSGGQQQRVAIARAVAAHPKVVLADEPTANLDSKTAEALVDLMLALNEQQGITFIFSTHDPLVMNKARVVVHLKDGRIL